MQIQFFPIFSMHNRPETETPKIKNLIGRMNTNTRAARTWEQYRAVLCKTTSLNYQVWGFDDNCSKWKYLIPLSNLAASENI